jgi:hypothetical protein
MLEWRLYQAENQRKPTDELAPASMIQEMWPEDADEDELDHLLSHTWHDSIAKQLSAPVEYGVK